MPQFTRFAFDIGTNSIGWAVLQGLRPDNVGASNQGAVGELTDILGAGVRIFGDGRNPKDGQSLAVMRRGPRAMRRRRDRFLQRQRKLRTVLNACGLPLPQINVKGRRGPDPFDPLRLRAEGLDRMLTPEELARALWHLNQRRGFQTNRKTDRPDESGKVKVGQKNLAEQLAGRTVGQWLHERRLSGARFRATPDPTSKSAGKTWFQFYPHRDMMKDEFDRLWTAQAAYHPDLLTEVKRLAVRDAIFRQRPLKPQPVGKCTLNPPELRAPKALPSVEAREIYERLNQIRYGIPPQLDQRLSRADRDVLARDLLAGSKVDWKKVRRLLKLPADTAFNLEELLPELPNSKTAARMKRPEAFGPAWPAMSLDERNAITEHFLAAEDEDDLAAWLVDIHGFEPDLAHKLASAPTPGADGYGSLGRTANAAILAELCDADGRHGDTLPDYWEAVRFAGERLGKSWHHSDFRDGEIWDRLPYYGVALERHVIDSPPDLREAVARFLADQKANSGNSAARPHGRRFKGAGLKEAETGRVPNPTVHIGLNQLRRVTNRLIEVYGHPDEIVLELARELKQTQEQKQKAEQENRKNREANARRAAAIEALGLPVNGETMMRHRLYDAQMVDGIVQCPYTLRTIELGQALGGGDVDVDHILPFSRSYDDSIGNKVLCYADANRQKGARAPEAAFGGSPQWPAILDHAQRLGRSRSWRFAPDAWDRFKEQGGFLGRQLNETKHLARIARAYMTCLTQDVWVVTGQMTALMRGKWGLNGILSDHNRKNRFDHRHHAVDAIVIGCTSRSLLQRISREAGKAEEQDLDHIFAEFPDPMPDFRNKAREIVNRIIVSHKPERGKGGALHEDTAYGVKGIQEHELALGNVVVRKPLDMLTAREVGRVRDEPLRNELLQLLADVGGDEKAFRVAAVNWAIEQAEAWNDAHPDAPPRMPIRRVRLLKPEASLLVLNDAEGQPTKGLVPAENWCVDIVKMRDGSWKGFGATIFEVNRKDWRPVWEREKLGGLLVMRLHKGDLIELEDPDGVRRVKRVVRLRVQAGQLMLAGAADGGDFQKRHDDPDDPFRWDYAAISGLGRRGATKVITDEIGNR